MVPYSHAVRLHGALEAAGARHELHTVPGGGGGGHGRFASDETVKIFERIHRFLSDHGITDSYTP